MRRFALFGALLLAAAQAAFAQQSGATISGEVSIGYADVTPWMAKSGGKGSTFAIIYDAAARRSYQVTVDSSLARAYGGLEAMRGKTVSLRVDAQNRATAIMSVVDERAKPARTAQRGVHAMDPVGYGVPDPYATGTKRVLGLGCNFKGATDRPWPGSEMSPVFFGAGGIEAFWKENSANQLNYASSKFIDGFRELPLEAKRYFPNVNAVWMDSLATACAELFTGDVNINDYDILVIHTSSAVYCCQVTADHLRFKVNGVDVRKSVVVVPGQAGVPFTNSVSITAHEMGHALGLPHSAPEDGNTYASAWDVMSAALSTVNSAGQRIVSTHTLAGHKDLLGWIPANRRFVTYGGTSTITLERNALPANNANYLIAEIPVGSGGAYYTVELRQKAGYDIDIPREGVIVNRRDPVAGTGDLLILDRDGNGNVNDDGAVLVAGQTYFDARSQFAVTVNAITGSSASVTITSGGGTLVNVSRLGSNTTIAAGAISNDSITIAIDGANASTIAWTATTDRPTFSQQFTTGDNRWLQVTTPSGTGPGQVRFRRNAAGLAPGTYIDSVTVKMPALDSAWSHVDTLTVTAPSTLYLGLSKILKRDSTLGQLLPDSLTVSLTGPGADQAAWTATATNGGRVSRLVENSGTGTRKIHFNAGPNINSAAGWYVDTIIVTLTATPGVRAMMIDSIHMVSPVIYSIPVRSHRDSLPAGYQGKLDSVVVGMNSPWSTTGRWNIELSQQAYDTSIHKAHVVVTRHDAPPNVFFPGYWVNGNGVAYYTRSAGGLRAGIYVDTIHVRGPFPAGLAGVPLHQGEQLVFDTLVVYETTKQIVLSRTSARDTVPLGMARSTDSVIVQATGRDTVHYTPVSKRHATFYLPGQPPTEAEAGNYDFTNYQKIRWNRNVTAITAPGVYVDTIVFQSVDGSLRSEPLYDSLVVLPASVLTVSSALRVASADAAGAAVADSVTVGSLANKAAAWTARKRKAWTTLTTTSGAVGDRVRWTRNPSGLAPGVYIDTISVGAAGFVSAALVDSFTVTGAQTTTNTQFAQAAWDADSLGGVLGYDVATTFSINVSPLNQSIGSYTVTLQWDSTVVKLDSTRAVAGGFPAPAVLDSIRRADRITLSAASTTGLSGTVPLTRMFFHFSASNVGRQTSISPTFTALKSSATNAELQGSVSVKPLKAIVIPGVVRGDVNLDGKLTSADALMLVKFLVGITPAPGSVFTFNPNGDANCNGKVEAVDLQYVLAKLVGLPVGTACVGTIK